MVVVELVAAGGAGAGAQAAIRTVAAASIGTGRSDMAGAYAGTPPAREFRAALVVPGYERLFGFPALRVAHWCTVCPSVAPDGLSMHPRCCRVTALVA